MPLLDALSGFKKPAEREGLEIEMAIIPPKTTALVLPLDRFFFRPWKVDVRKISDFVLFGGLNISLQNRNNVRKLQSLVHFQFSSHQYRPMIKYAWFASG